MGGDNPLELHRYPRFYVAEIPALGETSHIVAYITGEDAVHARTVLRMKPGDIAVLCDGNCNEAVAVLENYSGAGVNFRILEVRASAGETAVPITLYFACCKGGKNEFIVQKAVELGAARIVPLLTQRCVSRPDAASARRKSERYRKIAYEAAKQCGRGKLPDVCEFTEFADLTRDGLSAENLGIMFYELAAPDGKISGINFSGCKSVSVITGCEGGFTPEEAQSAQDAGFNLCTLGGRILRAETAPIAALTLILHELAEI